MSAKKIFIENHSLIEKKEGEKEKSKVGLSKEQLLQLDTKELAGIAFYADFRSNQLQEANANKLWRQSELNETERQLQETNRKLKLFQDRIGEVVVDPETNMQIKVSQALIDEMNEKKALLEQQERAFREYVEHYSKQEQQILRDINNTVPIKEVALVRTADTLAQAGIIALDTTREKKLRNPLCLTPENISPYEYGSHPDEMIEMVQKARQRMVELLTQKQVVDFKGQTVENPYYHKGLTEEQAKKLAEEHIKATLDTQHLGMWKRHFERRPGETEEQRDARFNRWYLKEVEKLAEKGVLGNVHFVDGMGLGHSHLPAQQGVYPVAEAIEKLRARGFRGSISSEGHGEGPERQLFSAWEAVGRPTGLYHANTQRAMSWTEVENSYFGSQKYPPNYIVGEFAKTISPDFTLWSGVPLE